MTNSSSERVQKNLVEKWHDILNASKPGAESPAETTGHINGKSEEKGTEAVTHGTKNLDLNGKDDALVISEMAGHDSLDTGDASMFADVTMSEA